MSITTGSFPRTSTAIATVIAGQPGAVRGRTSAEAQKRRSAEAMEALKDV